MAAITIGAELDIRTTNPGGRETGEGGSALRLPAPEIRGHPHTGIVLANRGNRTSDARRSPRLRRGAKGHGDRLTPDNHQVDARCNGNLRIRRKRGSHRGGTASEETLFCPVASARRRVFEGRPDSFRCGWHVYAKRR